MDKNFNVKNFTEEYEKKPNNTEKEQFLKSKLKTEKYLSYADKVTLAENIVKSSSYAITKDEGGLKQTDRIALNSPMRYILFVMTIIDKYTNIEVNFNDIIADFDALNFNGLIEVIFNKVGDKEITEFSTVVDMVLNDFMSNKYEFKNYINEIIFKVADIVEKCSPLIDNITNKLDDMSEDDVKKLNGMIEKITKYLK